MTISCNLGNPVPRVLTPGKPSVKQDFESLMEFLSLHKEQLGSLSHNIDHWLKITRSYWSGLFHCYQVEGLPKTNNDLEQVFGSFRHHSRRTTGRKKSPISLLIRGSSRLIAAVATRLKTFTASDLEHRFTNQDPQIF